MKGKIEIFYDMPLLAEYLELTGKKLTEKDVQSAIEPMVHEAVAYHLNDCAPMITGAIREMLINQPVAPRSREVFRSIPKDSLYIFFDEDEQRSQKISREIGKRKKNLHALMQRNGSNNKSYKLPVSPTKLKLLVDRVKVTNNVQYIEGMKTKIETQDAPKTPCKVLFLDLDGVLNTEDYFASLKDKGLPTEDSFGNLFSPEAVENLWKIIEATDAQIVVSSSWRFAGLGTLKLMWKERSLPGNLYDITSLFVADDYIRAHMEDQSFDFYEAMTSAREMEISAWLQEHPEVTNYVILDDLDSFRLHEAHLVKINPKTGITTADAERVITILSNKINSIMGYKELQCEKQQRLIAESDLFQNVKAGKVYRGKSREFILLDGQYNLYESIRDEVIAYFKNNDIQWWGGYTPTGHVLSSQIACINHLFPIRREHDILLSILNSATGQHFDKLLPIPTWLDKQEKTPHYVAFEAISKTDHLNEGTLSRGSNCTSLDTLMIAENKEGTWLIPIEWKYTELYQNEDKSNEDRPGEEQGSNGAGQVRLQRYQDLIQASKQLKGKYANYQGTIYFQEPYYQLMRQTLWTELSLDDYNANKYIHLHIVPSANKELLERRYKRFAEFDKGMVDTWRSLLTNPDLYICKDPQDIFAPLKDFDSKLYTYLQTRYWKK